VRDAAAGDAERVDFIDAAEWEEHISAAEELLHTTHSAFRGTPQADAILKLVGEEFGRDGIPVRPLPVAADSNPDGTMRWVGVDVILGDLAEPGADAGAGSSCAARPCAPGCCSTGTR
jgi:hypothetical protein